MLQQGELSVGEPASLVGEVTMGAFPCFINPIFPVIDGVSDAEEFAISIPIIPIFREGRRCKFGTGIGGPLTIFQK